MEKLINLPQKISRNKREKKNKERGKEIEREKFILYPHVKSEKIYVCIKSSMSN